MSIPIAKKFRSQIYAPVGSIWYDDFWDSKYQVLELKEDARIVRDTETYLEHYFGISYFHTNLEKVSQ